MADIIEMHMHLRQLWRMLEQMDAAPDKAMISKMVDLLADMCGVIDDLNQRMDEFDTLPDDEESDVDEKE